MVRFFLLVLLSLPFYPARSQSLGPANRPTRQSASYPISNQFEHLSIKDGLSNNSVNCILQDTNGYMWFGTNEGLNKYDGYTFTVFQPDPTRPARSLQHSHISGICQGENGVIWVTTEGGGLHEVNSRTGQVIPHRIVVAEAANRWSEQLSVYKDSQGLLWISTTAGLARYDPARHHFILYESPDSESPVKTVREDRQHRFWVATLRGLYLFDRKKPKFTLISIEGLKQDQAPTFISICQDKQDELWLGTATAGYSLFRLNPDQRPWVLRAYNPAGKLNPYVYLNSIRQDARGLIWVGTTNGLQLVDPVTDQVFTYQTDPNAARGLSSNSVQAIYHDRSGMLWLGTDNGIDRQARSTKAFYSYQVRPNEHMVSMIENRVNALSLDGRGQLWFTNFNTLYRLSADRQTLTTVPPEQFGAVGTHRSYPFSFLPEGRSGMWVGATGALCYLDPAVGRYIQYACDLYVQFIARAPNGLLWVGGEGGIASFNPETHTYTYYKYVPGQPGGLPDKYIHGILVSRRGDVWVLVKQLGLCRLDQRTGRFTSYKAGGKGTLSSNDVQSIYEDEQGILWIGTHLGGLNRFDPRLKKWSVITHQQGIPGNKIVSITADADYQLWLSTDKGLCRLNPKTLSVDSYETTDGLPSNTFLPLASMKQGRQLFFGSQNGVVWFDPAQIQADRRPFPVYITKLTVMDQPRPLTDSVIRLAHDESMLSFDFAALTYAQPERNQYAYRLEGVNPNWVQSGSRRFATYSNLSPGSYTFRVKAANSDGFWTPQQARVEVIVLPPWWATWWAYGLYALLAGGAIWGYIRFYTNRIQQRQELLLNRQQAQQLKAVDELKTRFFSNITHEFRTPLSLIIGPVEKLLQEKRFDASALAIVQRNAEQLLRLINQLLDLSKLEGNYMTVSLRQGQLTEFIDHLVELFRRAAEQKEVTLTSNLAHLPPHEYVFDADKWEKILTNLLSNALKFTPADGRVALTVKPVFGETALSKVQVELTDTGIGIAPDKLPHIFDRFYQADTSTTRAYEGTGIGLALVHELVQLLGGTITVESQLGVGTTFHLSLPVQPVSIGVKAPPIDWSTRNASVIASLPVESRVDERRTTDEHESLPRILIVEDNDELRAFIAGELEQAYYVLQAADGQVGWELAQAELPDIVLTDLMMPRMDGNELTHRIKSHPDTNHVAVVMLTAKAAQQSRLDGLQLGADDYLSKPFSVEEVKIRLHNLITRQRRLGDHYRQQFTLPGSSLQSEQLGHDPFLDRIYALIDEHLDDTTLTVDWLADQLAMTRRTLYRKVQSLIQLGPADLMRQYRLRKAAELLKQGHTVAETAERVGFRAVSHFSVVFKEFYHQTPTDYVATYAQNH